MKDTKALMALVAAPLLASVCAYPQNKMVFNTAEWGRKEFINKNPSPPLVRGFIATAGAAAKDLDLSTLPSHIQYDGSVISMYPKDKCKANYCLIDGTVKNFTMSVRWYGLNELAVPVKKSMNFTHELTDELFESKTAAPLCARKNMLTWVA